MYPYLVYSSEKDATLDESGGGGGSYTLPTASAETLGGVKVGTGLAIDGNGVLSASGGGGGSSVPVAIATLTFDGEDSIITADYNEFRNAVTANGLCVLEDSPIPTVKITAVSTENVINDDSIECSAKNFSYNADNGELQCIIYNFVVTENGADLVSNIVKTINTGGVS
jgi:hypothetical protein